MTLIIYRAIYRIKINLAIILGQCAVFDNHRVLHGRSGFEMHPDSSTRTYHGGYIDWDEMISKLNVLTDAWLCIKGMRCQVYKKIFICSNAHKLMEG